MSDEKTYSSPRQKPQEPAQIPTVKFAPPPIVGDDIGLIKTLSPATPPPIIVSSTPDVKPGWYTSEFWLTALVIIGVFVSLILGRITVNDIANLWPLFTGPAAYALSRGLAKKG